MGEPLHRMLGAKRSPTIVEPDAVEQLERSFAAQRLRGARTAAFVLGDSARDVGGDSGVDRAAPGAQHVQVPRSGRWFVAWSRDRVDHSMGYGPLQLHRLASRRIGREFGPAGTEPTL